MGADIHMKLIKDNKIIEDDLFEGRNYDWFDDLTGKGYCTNVSYKTLFDIKTAGIPEDSPKEIVDDYNEDWYFDFYWMKLKDFCNWVKTSRPQLEAGWVSTYDAWAYKKKGIIPEEMFKSLASIDEEYIKDYNFIEIVNKFEPSYYISEYLINKGYDIEDEDYKIVFYFDN